MTQRPELFKVALPAVGVLDMLRYHKFTAGAGWAYDYGTADADVAMFNYLHTYSPYHALKAGTAYTPTMITKAAHHDRVVPAHSFYVSEANPGYPTGSKPLLLRFGANATPGPVNPTDLTIA